MIRRPPRSTLMRSSAASDVYKRQPGECPRQTENGLTKPEVTSLSVCVCACIRGWRPNRWTDRHQIWQEGRGSPRECPRQTENGLTKPEVTSWAKNSPKCIRGWRPNRWTDRHQIWQKGRGSPGECPRHTENGLTKPKVTSLSVCVCVYPGLASKPLDRSPPNLAGR